LIGWFNQIAYPYLRLARMMMAQSTRLNAAAADDRTCILQAVYALHA
jgi:hypothetical protein